MPYLEIKSKVKGADAKTFENLGEDKMKVIGYFGKDSKNVYFLGKKLKDVMHYPECLVEAGSAKGKEISFVLWDEFDKWMKRFDDDFEDDED